jgi:hypothetical protein
MHQLDDVQFGDDGIKVKFRRSGGGREESLEVRYDEFR